MRINHISITSFWPDEILQSDLSILIYMRNNFNFPAAINKNINACKFSTGFVELRFNSRAVPKNGKFILSSLPRFSVAIAHH